MKIGYVCDAALEGNLALQRVAIKNAGAVRQIEERWNRSDASRPALEAAVASLAPGDTLIFWKMESLASTLSEIVTVLYRLKERGISYICAASGIEIDASGDAQTSWLIDALYSSARLHANGLSCGNKSSLPRGRIRGNRKGRRMALTEAEIATARDLIDGGASVVSVAKLLNVGRSTLYRSIRATASL